ncbi:MAG: HD domain-containing protein [Actinobacteria bacterium]|nr:MAG: HD domain-containing protein [Actinomycetota bacterium]TMM08178.1 MAG: HD domain-containing protein [Actinomycetota bacterium]
MDAIPTQTTLDAASATAPGCAKVFVRDLADGARVESPFVVRDVARKQKRNGEAFLKLQLGDVTGAIEGVVWEEIEDAAAAAKPGAVVVATGSFSVDPRYGACLTVRSLRSAASGEYDPADLLDGPSVAFEQMVADLRALIDTVQDRHLRALLDALLSERSPIWERWRDAPAAKYYHQAYRHGLLEHCLSVAQAVNAVSAAFPGIDRDLAVTGALLHDIGKIEAYAMTGGAIELSDSGRLQGEIPLGYYIVRRAIEDLPGFPPDRAEAVLHIILSHHGMLEHGSPVVPCTREATLVHMIDNLGGRLGSFDRIEKSLPGGERWSGFDRALAGPAYFATRGLGEAA